METSLQPTNNLHDLLSFVAQGDGRIPDWTTESDRIAISFAFLQRVDIPHLAHVDARDLWRRLPDSKQEIVRAWLDSEP